MKSEGRSNGVVVITYKEQAVAREGVLAKKMEIQRKREKERGSLDEMYPSAVYSNKIQFACTPNLWAQRKADSADSLKKFI